MVISHGPELPKGRAGFVRGFSSDVLWSSMEEQPQHGPEEGEGL